MRELPTDATLARERLSLPIPGGTLAITKFSALQPGPRASVIINCAMSVTQSFYRPFAQFLAARGYSVMTWDYRGVGESVMEASVAREVSLDHWAREDLSLVIAAAAASKPDSPVVVIGHSFGGQIIALPENRDAIAGAILIACPSGYVGHWRGKPRRSFLWGLAYLGLPILTRFCGCFPSSRLGLGTDLPRRVALEWGAWLRHPRYIARCPDCAARIASFTAPVHAISFSDDAFAPPNAVEAMLALYRGSRVTRQVVSPEDHGLGHIGHLGFFRARLSVGLWGATASRIDEISAGHSKSALPGITLGAS